MSMLTRWAPFDQLWREMNRVQRDLDLLLDRWGGGWRRPELALSFPALNVWQDEEFVYAEAELPGLKLDDLEIYVTGNDQLTIKGSRQFNAPENAVWHRQERPYGTFTRVITLPVPVDADKVEARLENGVLTVKMPKGQEAKPKRIAVRGE
jgi:HSP20 family protein